MREDFNSGLPSSEVKNMAAYLLEHFIFRLLKLKDLSALRKPAAPCIFSAAISKTPFLKFQ